MTVTVYLQEGGYGGSIYAVGWGGESPLFYKTKAVDLAYLSQSSKPIPFFVIVLP